MLVLFVALVASLSIAYKLFQLVKNRDTQDKETNRILQDLREQVNRLKDAINKDK